MDKRFSFRRRHADGNIFNGSSISCHRMSFKVRQNDIIVIICKMRTYLIFFQAAAAFHRNCHGTVCIHNIYVRNLRIAVIFRQLHMISRIRPVSAIGCIAFYDGSVYFFHKILYQFRTQIVASGFTCTDLDTRMVSHVFHVQSFIHLHQTVRADIFGHINFRTVSGIPLSGICF